MQFDPVTLFRVQFGFVISFHIIFPAFTIGLAACLSKSSGQYSCVRRAALLLSSGQTSPMWEPRPASARKERSPVYQRSIRTSSTRRFSLRPCSVSLRPFGFDDPKPWVSSRSGEMP